MDGCFFFHSRIAATSMSLSPCAGSAGAYGDFERPPSSRAGPDARATTGASAPFATGAVGILPASLAFCTHRRSDSVVVPIVAATRTHFIPDAISSSACCRCASSNRRARRGTRVSADTSAPLLTTRPTFFLTMTASLPASPDRGARPLFSSR